MALHFPTRAERPGRLPHIASLQASAWPELMYHADLGGLFERVVAEYTEFDHKQQRADNALHPSVIRP